MNASLVLRIAAVYNLLRSAWVVFFPGHFFRLTGLEQPNYPMIWQGLGMVIGVFGLGYWWAASDPVRHWPIVAVGFLGKISGPFGYFQNVVAGTGPVEFGYMLFINDSSGGFHSQ
jgi:hypothetical protein